MTTKQTNAEKMKALEEKNAQLSATNGEQQNQLQTLQQQLQSANAAIEATKSKAFDAITSRDERIKVTDGFLMNVAQFLGVPATHADIGKAIELLKANQDVAPAS
tara:strand:+ start:192 stop:506 length:315 start_codon:yes stop_codon:yes gene_type:complete